MPSTNVSMRELVRCNEEISMGTWIKMIDERRIFIQSAFKDFRLDLFGRLPILSNGKKCLDDYTHSLYSGLSLDEQESLEGYTERLNVAHIYTFKRFSDDTKSSGLMKVLGVEHSGWFVATIHFVVEMGQEVPKTLKMYFFQRRGYNLKDIEFMRLMNKSWVPDLTTLEDIFEDLEIDVVRAKEVFDRLGDVVRVWHSRQKERFEKTTKMINLIERDDEILKLKLNS